MGFSAVVLVLTLCATLQESPAGELPIAGRTIYQANFDLGELNRREIEDERRFLERWIYRVFSTTLPAYLEPVLETLGSPLPEFMSPVLRNGGDPAGDRYLAFDFEGGNALVTTRANPNETSLKWDAGARIHARFQARWDDLGAARWELLLRQENGNVFPLFLGEGASSDWQTFEVRKILPLDQVSGDLEIWLYGYQEGKRPGELGIDAIEVQIQPRIGVEWSTALGRVAPTDEHPFTVKSFALPSSSEPYQLRYEILAEDGAVLVEDQQPLLVQENTEMDFSPRIVWRELELARGVYTIRITVVSPDGGMLTESRGFALAGPPAFAKGVGATEWGITVMRDRFAPDWIPVVEPDAVLIPVLPPPDGLAPWLEGESKLSIHLAMNEVEDRPWRPNDAETIASWLRRYRNWYWTNDRDGAEIMDRLRQQAPYLRTGVRVAPGTQVPPSLMTAVVDVPFPGDRWQAVIDALAPMTRNWVARVAVPQSAQVDDDLARALYVAAAYAPRALFLERADSTLLRSSPEGERIPRRTLLVWDFVTAFLSSATFVGFEAWQDGVYCLTFRRDGEDFLVAFTDQKPAALRLHGGSGAQGFDSVGSPVPISVGTDGRTTVPVGPAPILVQNLDYSRIRTVRSLRVTSEGVGKNTTQQVVKVSLKNHYPKVLRATLDYELPAGWVAQKALEPLHLDSGTTRDWELTLRVPSFLGASGETALGGSLTLTPESGAPVAVPIEQAIPVESPLLSIRTLGLGDTDSEVAIRNRTDRTLVANIYLAAQPGAAERTFLRQTFPPGVELKFRIEYPGATVRNRTPDVDPELLVSVAVPAEKAFVNRVFALP